MIHNEVGEPEATLTMPTSPVLAPVPQSPGVSLADLPLLFRRLPRKWDRGESSAFLPLLTDLLWNLGPAEGRFLDTYCRERLRRRLVAGWGRKTLSEEEADFLTAVCKALTTIADPKTLRLLQRQSPAKAPVDPNACTLYDAISEFGLLLESEVAGRIAHRKELMTHLKLPIENGVNRREFELARAQMGPEAAHIALREIVEVHVRRERQSRSVPPWMKVVAGIGMIIVLIIIIAEFNGKVKLFDVWYTGSLSWMVLSELPSAIRRLRGGNFYVPIRPSQTGPLHRAAWALTEYASKEDLEPLLMALQYGGQAWKVETTVTRLLTDLTAEDAHWLSAEARGYLKMLLGEWKEMPEEMRTAAEHALAVTEPPQDPAAKVGRAEEGGTGI